MSDDPISAAAARALPCRRFAICFDDSHPIECPADKRPAVEAEMRALAAEVVREMVDAVAAATEDDVPFSKYLTEAMRQRARKWGVE